MSNTTLDLTFGGRLRNPLIVAPMFLVSSPAMTLAVCSRGVLDRVHGKDLRIVPAFGARIGAVSGLGGIASRLMPEMHPT